MIARIADSAGGVAVIVTRTETDPQSAALFYRYARMPEVDATLPVYYSTNKSMPAESSHHRAFYRIKSEDLVGLF